MYSARSGKALRRVAAVGYVSNGLALSVDAKTIYFTRSTSQSLWLMRLNVASGRQARVAKGSEPAFDSSDSRLAYAASSRELAVRSLKTSKTRTLSLVKQLGTSSTLVGSVIAWLANGAELAILPASQPVLVASGAQTSSGDRSVCQSADGNPGILFVDLRGASVRCVRTSAIATGTGVALSGDSSSRASVLLARSTGHRALIEKISQRGEVNRVAILPNSQPMAFSPSGQQILYLRDDSLWKATVGAHGLESQHRLVTGFEAKAVVW